MLKIISLKFRSKIFLSWKTKMVLYFFFVANIFSDFFWTFWKQIWEQFSTFFFKIFRCLFFYFLKRFSDFQKIAFFKKDFQIFICFRDFQKKPFFFQDFQIFIFFEIFRFSKIQVFLGENVEAKSSMFFEIFRRSFFFFSPVLETHTAMRTFFRNCHELVMSIVWFS